MNQAKDNLVAARDLLLDKRKWTQHEFARDERGDMTNPIDPRATCFCALGALYSVVGHNTMASEDDDDSFEQIPGYSQLHTAAKEWRTSIPDVNDERGYDAVLEMYGVAIALADQPAAS